MSFLRRLTTGHVAILGVLAVGALALVTREQWDWLLEDGSVQSEGVTAPALEDVDDESERLYRIGDGSVAFYEVDESLGGRSGVAVGWSTIHSRR